MYYFSDFFLFYTINDLLDYVNFDYSYNYKLWIERFNIILLHSFKFLINGVVKMKLNIGIVVKLVLLEGISLCELRKNLLQIKKH